MSDRDCYGAKWDHHDGTERKVEVFREEDDGVQLQLWIGKALTVLKLTPEAAAALRMGMNHLYDAEEEVMLAASRALNGEEADDAEG